MGVAAWALVISIFAATTSLASLVWQIISWRRTGPSLRIECVERLPPGERALEVKVFNRGRGDVELVQVYLHYPDPSFTRRLRTEDLSAVFGLPITVEGQHGRSWKFGLTGNHRPPTLGKRARISLQLGSGKVVTGAIEPIMGRRSGIPVRPTLPPLPDA